VKKLLVRLPQPQDLVGFLSELHALGIGLYLYQQGLDTTTPAGKAMFQMLAVSDRSAGNPSRAACGPSAPPTRLAGSACEPLPHSSVLGSRPFAAASVEAAATHPDVR
jgi:hypothetical protein